MALFTVGESGAQIPLQCNLAIDPTVFATTKLRISRPRGLAELFVTPSSLSAVPKYARYAFTAGEVAADGTWGWTFEGTHADGSVVEDWGTFDVAPKPQGVPK